MKTLLEMGQYVARRSHIRVPVTIIGNPDKNARLILSTIQEAADEMVREYNWTQLIFQVKIEVALGITSNKLARDFDRLVDDTVWSVTDQQKLGGPLDYDEWQYITNTLRTPGGSCFSLANATEVLGDDAPKLQVYSVTDDNQLSLYYCSNKHVYSPQVETGQNRENFESDNDSTVMDCLCVQQFALCKTLDVLGMDYADAMRKYNDMMKERVNRDRGSDRVSLNSRSVGSSRYGYGACRRRNDPIGVNLPYPYR